MTIGNPFEKGDNILKTQPSFLNFKSIKATTLSAITGVLLATSDLQAQEPTKTTPKKPKTEEVSKIAPKKPKTEEVSKKTPINTIEQFTNIKGISSMIECNKVSDNTISSAFKNYKKVQKLEGGVIDNQYEIARCLLGIEFFKAKRSEEYSIRIASFIGRIKLMVKSKESKEFIGKWLTDQNALKDKYRKKVHAAMLASTAKLKVSTEKVNASTEKVNASTEKVNASAEELKRVTAEVKVLKKQVEEEVPKMNAAIKKLKK